MPSSSRHARTNSPPTSTYASTTAQQQRVNVVKKLAIEGNAERGSDGKADGASLKMYLRISLPANGITPGATIPLFPEENLKILDSQVHPLDASTAPYAFSTSLFPLLRKASHALNLPSRTKDSYLSLFSSSSTSNQGSIPPLDERYTGHILVSGYWVSYVLPKEFPPRSRESDSVGRAVGRRLSNANEIHFMAAIDMWAPFLTKPPFSPYLLSIPVPRCLQNHIHLRIFPPTTLTASLASLSSAEGDSTTWDLTSDPHVTRAPPQPQSHSRRSSLSSRTNTRSLSRNSSYNSFADDETSEDSANGSGDGYAIKGTFPSAERMRVRWAAPVKRSEGETGDGRRRVGIKEVKSEMNVIVLGKHRLSSHPTPTAIPSRSQGRPGNDSDSDLSEEEGREGVLMKLEYTAMCRGVWFPGVATMLGMDVGLNTGDCEVQWAPAGVVEEIGTTGPEGRRIGGAGKWSVTGGPGFTGYAVGGPPPQLTPFSSPSKPKGKSEAGNQSVSPQKGYKADKNKDSSVYIDGTSRSSASLLRAPLPQESMSLDDSYDPTASPTETPLSSLGSFGTVSSSPERERRTRSRAGSLIAVPNGAGLHSGNTDTDTGTSAAEDGEVPVIEGEQRPPKAPITVHVNMNELLPPSKNVFTFTVTGLVIVFPPSDLSSSQRNPFLINGSSVTEDDEDEAVVTLPHFKVFYTDKEVLGTLTLRNEAEEDALDVYNPRGPLSDPQTRRTVVQPYAQTRYGADGIGLRMGVRALPGGAYGYNYGGYSPGYARQRTMSTGSTGHRGTRREGSVDSPRVPSRPRTPNGASRVLASPGVGLGPGRSLVMSTPRVKRDGALMIPEVRIIVTPLVGRREKVVKGYAVRVMLPAPSEAEEEWLEFGLALPPVSGNEETETRSRKGEGKKSRERPPKVEMASASVEGVPVKFEATASKLTSSAETDEKEELPGLGIDSLNFGDKDKDKSGAKEWVTWIRVHTGDAGGGKVQVVYIVKIPEEKVSGNHHKKGWFGLVGKGKGGGEEMLGVLLPSFALPVGMLEVNVEAQSGLEVASLQHNLTHDQPSSTSPGSGVGYRLLHYSLPEFFYPALRLSFSPTISPSSQGGLHTWIWRALAILSTLMTIFLLINQKALSERVIASHEALEACARELNDVRELAVTDSNVSEIDMITETVTSVMTVYVTQTQKAQVPSVFSAIPDTTPAETTTTTIHPTPTTLPTITPIPVTSLGESDDAREDSDSDPSSLSPFLDTHLLWPLALRFQIPHIELDMPGAARATARGVARGLGMAWHVFRRVLHYPLDPP